VPPAVTQGYGYQAQPVPEGPSYTPHYAVGAIYECLCGLVQQDQYGRQYHAICPTHAPDVPVAPVVAAQVQPTVPTHPIATAAPVQQTVLAEKMISVADFHRIMEVERQRWMEDFRRQLQQNAPPVASNSVADTSGTAADTSSNSAVSRYALLNPEPVATPVPGPRADPIPLDRVADETSPAAVTAATPPVRPTVDLRPAQVRYVPDPAWQVVRTDTEDFLVRYHHREFLIAMEMARDSSHVLAYLRRQKFAEQSLEAFRQHFMPHGYLAIPDSLLNSTESPRQAVPATGIPVPAPATEVRAKPAVLHAMKPLQAFNIPAGPPKIPESKSSTAKPNPVCRTLMERLLKTSLQPPAAAERPDKSVAKKAAATAKRRLSSISADNEGTSPLTGDEIPIFEDHSHHVLHPDAESRLVKAGS